MFQSLVGTLKTQEAKLPQYPPLLVSIPCRYAKNEEGAGLKCECGCGFQSLVGTLKTGVGRTTIWARV